MSTARPFPEALYTYINTLTLHQQLVHKSFGSVLTAARAASAARRQERDSSAAAALSPQAVMRAVLEGQFRLHKVLFENLFVNMWDSLLKLLEAYDVTTDSTAQAPDVAPDWELARARRQLLLQPSAHMKFIAFHRPPMDGGASAESQVARRTVALSAAFSEAELQQAIRCARDDIGCAVLLLPEKGAADALRGNVVSQYFAPQKSASADGIRPSGDLEKLVEIARKFCALRDGAVAWPPPRVSSGPAGSSLPAPRRQAIGDSRGANENAETVDLLRMLELLEEATPGQLPPHRVEPGANPSPATTSPLMQLNTEMLLPQYQHLQPTKRSRQDEALPQPQPPSTGASSFSPKHVVFGDVPFNREESQVVAYHHSQGVDCSLEKSSDDDADQVGVGGGSTPDPEDPLVDLGQTRRVFQLSQSLKEDRAAVLEAIGELGGVVDRRSAYSAEATHFIVAEGLVERTEKFLSFCAARKAIVTPRYIIDSVAKGAWIVDDRDYDINPQRRLLALRASAPPPRRQSGPFEGWKVWLFASKNVVTGIQTILTAGGCQHVRAFPGPDAVTGESSTDGDVQQRLLLGSGFDAEARAVSHFIVEPRFVSVAGPSSVLRKAVAPDFFPPRLHAAYQAKVFTLELLYYVLCLARRRLFGPDGALAADEGADVPMSCRISKP
jgi:hypothetical protein